MIPHHYDMTKPLFDKRPELATLMLSQEARDKYFVDGSFNNAAFVEAYKEAIVNVCPSATMMEIEHHKWYRFALAVAEA